MNINITQLTINKCKEVNIKADHIGSCLFVLNCLYHNEYELLNSFDDFNTKRNALIIYKELEYLGLLQVEEAKDKYWSLSPIGKVFVETLDNNTVIENVQTIKPTETVKDWIKDWLQLWKDPDTGYFYKVKADRRTLGANEQDTWANMMTFLKLYNKVFTNIPEGMTIKDVIFKATENYIAQFKKVNFTFCKNALYFIMKNKQSELANQCEFVLLNPEKETPKDDFTFGTSLN